MINARAFFRPTLLLLSGAAWLLSLPLHGQDTVEKPKPASLRFLFLDETPGAYSLKNGPSFRQISSAPYAISPPIILQPKGRLEIYQTAPLPDPITGKKDLVKIAAITPPDDVTSALVVVTPHPAAPGTSSPPAPDVTYFKTDSDSFPAGGIRVINLGRAPLGTQFDKAPAFQLQPGETRIVSPTPDSKNRVAVKIAVSEGDAWKLLSNKIAILKPGQRMTGVFVYSPSGLLHTYTAEELAEFGKPKPGHFWLTYTDTP
jgi:hypothetical protein